MKKVAILVLAVVAMTACNNSSKETKETEGTKVYTLAEFLNSADELKDQTVALKGMVVHVCKHGGQKMFITSEDKELKLRVDVSNSIPEFDVALEGSVVEINGLVVAEAIKIEGEHKGAGEQHEESAKAEEAKEGGCEHETEACAEKHENGEECEHAEEGCDEETTEEEDCEFEKTTVTYSIKASSVKEIE